MGNAGICASHGFFQGDTKIYDGLSPRRVTDRAIVLTRNPEALETACKVAGVEVTLKGTEQEDVVRRPEVRLDS